MKHIAILDQDNGRAIYAQVPSYLTDSGADDDTIAEAIFEALGLQSGTEYMIGDFPIVLADHNADTSRKARGIELLAKGEDFRRDAEQYLKDAGIYD